MAIESNLLSVQGRVNVNERLVALCEATRRPYIAQRLRDRDAVGRARYGTSLMTHNGRNAAIDAEEELLDLVQYLYQMVLEGNLSGAESLLALSRSSLALIDSEVQRAKSMERDN